MKIIKLNKLCSKTCFKTNRPVQSKKKLDRDMVVYAENIMNNNY